MQSDNNAAKRQGPTGKQPADDGASDAQTAYRDAATASRDMVRTSLKAALATFDKNNDEGSLTPYASLVTTATGPSGAPILLISKLARHTRNLDNNPRSSLLFDGTGPTGDPLAGGRVTVWGQTTPTTDPAAKRRFLSRHPESEMYASFSDFGFYEMAVEGAHYIGGFGRIVDIKRDDLLTNLSDADSLLAAEPDIVAHMNADHADALELYATRLLKVDPDQGPWRMSGIDPAGFDIVGPSQALRLSFRAPITTPNEARMELKRLADEARGMNG